LEKCILKVTLMGVPNVEGLSRCYSAFLYGHARLLGTLSSFVSIGCESQPIFSCGTGIPSIGGLARSSHDTKGSEDSSQSGFGDSVFPDDELRGLPTHVKFDEVLNVQSAEFAGFVHNLETSSGEYTASGYVVSNCKAPRLNFYDYAGPEATAIIEHCRPYLDELIDRLHPRVIIPMGNVALRRICGVSGINAHQCYVCDTSYGIPAVPTFHPSFVMQDNLKFTPCVLFAFRKALEIAKCQ